METPSHAAAGVSQTLCTSQQPPPRKGHRSRCTTGLDPSHLNSLRVGSILLSATMTVTVVGPMERPCPPPHPSSSPRAFLAHKKGESKCHPHVGFKIREREGNWEAGDTELLTTMSKCAKRPRLVLPWVQLQATDALRKTGIFIASIKKIFGP